VIKAVAQADAVEERLSPLARRPALSSQLQWNQDVLDGRERRQEMEGLEDEADLL